MSISDFKQPEVLSVTLMTYAGIGGYFGNPFNVMSQLAIFIIMGIGVGMFLHHRQRAVCNSDIT